MYFKINLRRRNKGNEHITPAHHLITRHDNVVYDIEGIIHLCLCAQQILNGNFVDKWMIQHDLGLLFMFVYSVVVFSWEAYHYCTVLKIFLYSMFTQKIDIYLPFGMLKTDRTKLKIYPYNTKVDENKIHSQIANSCYDSLLWRHVFLKF